MTRRPRLAPSAAETGRRTKAGDPGRTHAAERKAAGLPALDVLRAAAEAAISKKARAPVALDLRELDGVCDYFFICSASSEVQVKAVAEGVEDALRARGVRPWHIEGFESRRWVLLDYVEVVVHVFHEKTREYYMLDRLWGDARSLDLGLERAD